jgi:integrase/recombinase XerD
MNGPIITIFVRHTSACKYRGDEFHKGCKCRKHLRWSQGGKQFRRTAGTRSWGLAEDAKKALEADLSGKPLAAEDAPQHTVSEAIGVFMADKRNQGVSAGVEKKYVRELKRLQTFCERKGVYTVGKINRELLVLYSATWDEDYPSTATRFNVQARLRHFLKFCYDSKWLERVPKMSRIRVDAPPTMPLTAKEYERLLATVPKSFPDAAKAMRVRGLIQTMRWSGLAIRDAVTLKRDEIQFNKAKKLHSILTSRQKTGTHCYVPIPPEVAAEILKVLNGNPVYVFWATGTGKETSAVTNWQHDLRKLFKDAGIKSEGHMLSHRLRDTFACDLLAKGVPLQDVSKMLGHESIKTTEKSYAKWIKGRQDRLDSIVSETCPFVRNALGKRERSSPLNRGKPNLVTCRSRKIATA